jgi:hypothetical protein
MPRRITHEIAGLHRIEVREDRGRAQPVDDLELVADRRRRVGAVLRDHQRRRHASHHRLGEADHVVAGSARVDRLSEVVGPAITAEAQLSSANSVPSAFH